MRVVVLRSMSFVIDTTCRLRTREQRDDVQEQGVLRL